MVGTVQNDAGNVRINGKSLSTEATMTVRSHYSKPVGSNGSAKAPGVTENFKSALLSRAERFQKSGQTENSDPAAAQALADSLGQAATQVKEIYGQEASNAFMAKVLSGVEGKTFSYDSLTEAVGSALRYVAQTGRKKQLEEITRSFNQDLAASAEGGRDIKSLSRGLGDFFGLEAEEKKGDLTAMGFDAKGNWGAVKVVPEEEAGSSYITGTPEAALAALKDCANFTFKTTGTEIKDNLANFLRREIGAEEAAAFLDSAPEEADFMSTLDRAIDLALKEKPDQSPVLEKYLNSEVKAAVNASAELNQNPFGQVYFEGWNLSAATASDEEESGGRSFAARWSYLNRDDVAYVRGGDSPGTAPGKEGDKKFEAAAEEELNLENLVKKITYGDSISPQTGELVETTV